VCVHCSEPPAIVMCRGYECGDPPKITPKRRALAIGAAIIPGIVVRGAGSWVAGEKQTAKKLLYVLGGSLVVAGITGGLIGGTGGHAYTTPLVPFAVTSFGGILTSWIADIWTAAGGDGLDLRPHALPPWSIEAGSTWQKDAYRGRLLGRVGARARLGRVELGTTILAHVAGESLVGYGNARIRILGDEPVTAPRGVLGTPDDPLFERWSSRRRFEDEIADGSRLAIRVGGRLQRDDEDMTTQRVGELELEGRLDLFHLDRLLRGTFVESAMGIGALQVTYSNADSELDSILLTRFAWGMYLPTGELALYYDHRRDGLAGGIAAWRAAGYIGSIGAALDLGITGPWAVHGEVQFGNAWLTTLALAYRGGTR
jgi:hypothetical protein